MSRAEKYDVVIIGSGLGGLVCGTILAKEGKRVCIVEKNDQIGGNLQTFRRDGVTFDTGVHYIGGLEKGQNLHQFFTYLNIMDRLDVVKMDTKGFDVILFNNDENEYPYGMGYQNFISQLTLKFPEEQAAIQLYCDEIQNICQNFPLYNLRKEDYYQNIEVFEKSAKRFIESISNNKKLQAVLAGSNMLYAGDGEKTPLYIHALVVNSYIQSAWKCEKGGDQIAKLLAKNIRAAGGAILRKKEVAKINVVEGKAISISLKDGEEIFGDVFISNLHPAKTLSMTESELIRPIYRKRIESIENTISMFVLYAVLKPNTVKFKNRNYYCFRDENVWDTLNHTEENWPKQYGIFEVVPEKNKEFTEAVAVLTYMHFDEVKQWANTVNTTLEENERGADYETFKKRKAEKLIQVMSEKFPELCKNIQSYYTSTPLSNRDYIGTSDGNIYGIVRDFNSPLKTFISPNTKIENLYLTGQSMNLHGVLGVTVGAVITCSMLLGKEYLINKIIEANEVVV